jgi:diaminopimelate epimerase
MLTSRSFSKYHGAGNDFLLFDDFEALFPESDSALIAALCNRKTGIGADGLILTRSSLTADFSMLYFNADGSSSPLCGNGLRSLCACQKELGRVGNSCVVETGAGLLTVKWEKEKIFTQFPLLKQQDVPEGTFIDTGAPHLVRFSSDLEKENVLSEGRRIRSLPYFAPAGVNVTFIQPLSPNELGVRVYEKGVEAETLACGTGAMAGAIVAAARLGWKGTIGLHTRSHERLEASIGDELWLSGPAVKVFEGVVNVAGVFQKTT